MQDNKISMLTEKYSQLLRAKFSEDQAQVLMGIWAQGVSLHPDATTKTDLETLRIATKSGLEKLELKMTHLELKMTHQLMYIRTGGMIIISALFAIIFKIF